MSLTSVGPGSSSQAPNVSSLDPQAVRDLVAGMLVDADGNPFPYDGLAGLLTIPSGAAVAGGGGGGSGGGGTGDPADAPVYAIRETFASEAANAEVSAFEVGGAFEGSLRLRKVGSSAFARDVAAGLATAPSRERATIEALLRYDGPVDAGDERRVDVAHSVGSGAGIGEDHYWIRALYQGGSFRLQAYQRVGGVDYPQFSGPMGVVAGDPFRIRVSFSSAPQGNIDIAGSYRRESDAAWTAVGVAHTDYPYGDYYRRSGFKRDDLSGAADWARGEFRVVNA